MTVTSEPTTLLYRSVQVGSAVDASIGVWTQGAQLLNHVAGESRPVAGVLGALSPFATSVEFAPVDLSTDWTEMARFTLRVPADVDEVRWYVRGAHPAETAQVRWVEDPDGAATVRDTITLGATATLQADSFAIGSGDVTIAIEVRNPSASDAAALLLVASRF